MIWSIDYPKHIITYVHYVSEIRARSWMCISVQRAKWLINNVCVICFFNWNTSKASNWILTLSISINPQILALRHVALSEVYAVYIIKIISRPGSLAFLLEPFRPLDSKLQSFYVVLITIYEAYTINLCQSKRSYTNTLTSYLALQIANHHDWWNLIKIFSFSDTIK